MPRIKGSHNAILAGIIAADALAAGRANDDALDVYENAWRKSELDGATGRRGAGLWHYVTVH